MNPNDVKAKYKLQISSEEMQVLQANEAMEKIQRNTDLLALVNNDLLEEQHELGMKMITVNMLKSVKSTLIEQNRALKEILKGERL